MGELLGFFTVLHFLEDWYQLSVVLFNVQFDTPLFSYILQAAPPETFDECFYCGFDCFAFMSIEVLETLPQLYDVVGFVQLAEAANHAHDFLFYRLLCAA